MGTRKYLRADLTIEAGGLRKATLRETNKHYQHQKMYDTQTCEQVVGMSIVDEPPYQRRASPKEVLLISAHAAISARLDMNMGTNRFLAMILELREENQT